MNDADLLLLLRQCGYANLPSVLDQPVASMGLLWVRPTADNDRSMASGFGRPVPTVDDALLGHFTALHRNDVALTQYRCGIILSTFICNACITLSFVRFSDVSGNKKNKRLL